MHELGVCNDDSNKSQVYKDGTDVWEGDRDASQVCRGGQIWNEGRYTLKGTDMQELGVCNGNKNESQVYMKRTDVWEGERDASQVCKSG